MTADIPGEVALWPSRRRIRLPGAPVPETAQRALQRTVMRLVGYLVVGLVITWLLAWVVTAPTDPCVAHPEEVTCRPIPAS